MTMLIPKIRALLQAVRWWGGLEEVWQPGYSWGYREFRLREAFGLLPKDPPA